MLSHNFICYRTGANIIINELLITKWHVCYVEQVNV